jgi:heat shock protein HslJ
MDLDIRPGTVPNYSLPLNISPHYSPAFCFMQCIQLICLSLTDISEGFTICVLHLLVNDWIKIRGLSSAGLEHYLDRVGVEGSNPSDPTMMRGKICSAVCVVAILGCSPPKDTSRTNVNTATQSALLMSPTTLLEKSAQGIDFVAIGNSPDWFLDLDLQKNMLFKNLADKKTISTPASKEPATQDASTSRFFSDTEKGLLIVTLTAENCTDKYGNKFDHSVKVELKYANDEISTLYKGCGKYLPDYRLHNIWVVTTLYGKDVPPDNSPKGAPELEINPNDKMIIGHGGCNSFSGKVKVMGDEIYFGPVASTKMACPEMQTENQFFEILAKPKLNFEVEANSLRLFDMGKEVMTLKNVD